MAVVLILLAGRPAEAELRLAGIFGDHMVLQRDRAIPVWGWADAGARVTVSLSGRTTTAVAGDDGRWRAALPALPAGGPFTLAATATPVAGSVSAVTCTNVLLGDVWVCSGQSNMEWPVGQCRNAAEARQEARFPQIRHIAIPTHSPASLREDRYNLAVHPQDDMPPAKWVVCSPDTVGEFTAVGYFFGRELHKAVGVPIGLINASWSGTRIEPWTPAEGFAATPELAEIQRQVQDADPIYRSAVTKAVSAIEQWLPSARQAVSSGRLPAAPPAWPIHALDSPKAPTSIYNAMIHPLLPYAIRGAVWDQGESNRGDTQYLAKMKALIGGWRAAWGQGDFPFYYVMLAPGGHGGQDPIVWEGQRLALAIPRTGMAVTADIGGDLHPANKEDVGKRLALWALAQEYSRTNLVYMGPLYKAMRVDGDRVRLEFDHVGGGLASRDGQPLTWFTIAGTNRSFTAATAVMDGDTVLVSSPRVKAPVAVRFAWSGETGVKPNLMNKEGLPAAPFRTDCW